MPPWPWVDDRAAELLLDLASQLEAGLDPRAALGEAAAGQSWEQAIVASLAAARIELAPFERALLAAAEHGGRLPAALRHRAEARRQRAARVRELGRGVRYPIALLVVAAMAARVTGVASLGHIAIYAAATLLAVWGVARALRGPWGSRLRLSRELQRDRAEVAYLEAMHALYASGVKLRDAHPRALAAVPVLWVRAALFASDAALQRGESLSESLTATRALGDETLRILTPGERAGNLEDALARALQRRRETLARRVRGLLWAVRTTATLIAFGVALWVIFTFYGRVYPRLR